MIIDILVTMIVFPWGGMVMMFPMLLAAPGFKENKRSLLEVVIIFCYPAFIFLGYLIFNRPYFGISPGTIFLISAALCLGAISLFDLRRLTINAFRGIANTGYHKTASKVYWNGKVIHQASPDHFEILSEHYAAFARDKQHAYCQGKPIAGADAASFMALDDGYAKDESRVYRYNHMTGMVVVEDADPKTFVPPPKKAAAFFDEEDSNPQ
jgi:hypothetical protein